MKKIRLLMLFTLALSLPLTTVADDKHSFGGIKFGMHAEELAKLGGGDTEFSCASALNTESIMNPPEMKPWVYLGLDAWVALCMEDKQKSMQVPEVSGLIELLILVADQDNEAAKEVDQKTYSIEDLAASFSTVFGDFKISTQTTENKQGKRVAMKVATATNKDAVVKIQSKDLTVPNDVGFHTITITNLEYLEREAAWKKSSEN